MIDEDLVAGHRQELRRGTVVLACLLALRTPGYGYGLLKTLETAGIPSDANTIYPLLRRLEERGLLVSVWNTDESRPRKFYRTSPQGAALADRLLAEMNDLTASLHALNGGTPHDLAD
ncbi:MAG TPA: PadR family transcriptional regulator [candidate division Zixibacteria bacterium]|nr:PadR family transcriptional regulator [candidate division Zixibacteria bacterium]